jgi:hypothetical protein
MFRLLFAGSQPLFAWHGGIEALCKRGGTAQRINACHDRTNDDVRKYGGRNGGDCIDRATHWNLPWRLRRTVLRRTGNERKRQWDLGTDPKFQATITGLPHTKP